MCACLSAYCTVHLFNRPGRGAAASNLLNWGRTEKERSLVFVSFSSHFRKESIYFLFSLHHNSIAYTIWRKLGLCLCSYHGLLQRAMKATHNIIPEDRRRGTVAIGASAVDLINVPEVVLVLSLSRKAGEGECGKLKRKTNSILSDTANETATPHTYTQIYEPLRHALQNILSYLYDGGDFSRKSRSGRCIIYVHL